jgi:hypothetical protein
MKRAMLIAAALLMVSPIVGHAQQRGGNAGGASESSPGDQLRDQGGPRPGSHGASEFAPGDQRKDARKGAPRSEGRGASEFSPGDRAKDSRSNDDVQRRR